LEHRIAAELPDLTFIHPFGGSDDRDHYIFRPGCLTVSTVYGAKGYDAPLVFVVGADRFSDANDGRAAFYVAATRAKLFLTVTGVDRPDTLLREAMAVRALL
jgi:superfamily I DNA and RNA helicase